MKILNRWTGSLIMEIADLCGANLCGANLCGADLCGADLCGADLCGADLCGADLCGADLRDANLRDADLRDADLWGADLCGADLWGADLCGADLCDAENLPEPPMVPNIDAVILGAIESGGCLKMDAWHTCETTHCRAGWAITLAGEAGKKLESETSSWLAGYLIYRASRSGIEPPNFFASDEEALEDIRKSARQSL